MLAAGLLLGLTQCTLYYSDVRRTHDLTYPPAEGAVFIAPGDSVSRSDAAYSTYAADAYGWLNRWGYAQAPSAEQADYVVHLDYHVTSRTVLGQCRARDAAPGVVSPTPTV